MNPNPRRTLRSDLLNAVAAAIIALLIWAYANDRTRESATVAGTVRLTPSDPREQWVDPSSAVQVSVELRGSRRSIEAAEDAFRTGLQLAIGGSGLPSGDGQVVASLRDVLSSNSTIAATGAEVLRVRPESLRYEAGALVTEQVPVVTSLPNAAVSGGIVAEPAVVALTLPAAARQTTGALHVDAAVDTRNLVPGKPQRIDVELRLPEALARWREQCRVVPPRAVVAFELVATTAELRVARVPVRIAIDPVAADRWEVTPEAGSDAVTDVTLTGPRTAIESIAAGRFEPSAVIDLGTGPARVGTADYPVTFWRLPEGVSVLPADRAEAGSMPTVRLRVLPRNPTSAP